MTICIWRFPPAMDSGPAGHCRCPKFFGACARLLGQEQLSGGPRTVNYYEHVSYLVTWSIATSVIHQDGNDDMPNLPKHSCPGTSKHSRTQAGNIECMAVMKSHGSSISMVITVTSNKSFWIPTYL